MILLKNNQIEKITELVQNPIDYYDFPDNAYAFATSMKTSYPLIENDILWRKYGNTLTLITWKCPNEELLNMVNYYKSRKYKIKSLNYVNKNFNGLETKSYHNEWLVPNLDYNTILNNMKSKVRRDVKKGFELFTIDFNIQKYETLELFNKWEKWAKQRLFMVIKGHYLSFIMNYFDKMSNNSYIIGLRENKTNELKCIIGFEIFKNKAVSVLIKHIDSFHGMSKFARLMMVKSILEICPNIEIIFEGTTCDNIKNAMGFVHNKSYKLNI